MGVAKESIPTRLASNFTIQGLSGDCRILEPYAGPRQVQSMFSYLTTDESTTSEYTNGEVDFEAQLYYGYTCTTFWYLYPHLIPLLYVLQEAILCAWRHILKSYLASRSLFRYQDQRTYKVRVIGYLETRRQRNTLVLSCDP